MIREADQNITLQGCWVGGRADDKWSSVMQPSWEVRYLVVLELIFTGRNFWDFAKIVAVKSGEKSQPREI